MPEIEKLDAYNESYHDSAHGGSDRDLKQQAFFTGLAKTRLDFITGQVCLDKDNLYKILEIGPGPNQLTKDNLPSEKNKGVYENNTIISWYAESSNRSENIFTNVDTDEPIKINNKHLYGTKSPWPRLKSLITLMRLVFWAVVFFFKSTIKLFQGQFVLPIMIREIMLAKLVYHLNSSHLPRRYFFHNSGFFFRPLWTYVAQNKGVQIILYYYSTSDLWLQTKKGDTNCYNPYHIMTWPDRQELSC